MKKSPRNISFFYFPELLIILSLIMVALIGAPAANALPVSHYASASRMATGKWMKVRVPDPGMYMISDSELRQMGFSDPTKVRVYGYGSASLGDALSEKLPDDLPEAPSVRRGSGLLFYAGDYMSWTPRLAGDMKYRHTQNPYTEEIWYFLSDIGDGESAMPESEMPLPSTADIPGARNSFISRQVHELDLAAPSNTGRDLFGEDFRATPRQTFNFKMPGKVSDRIALEYSFGANTTSGSGSTVTLAANGVELPSTGNDKIRALTSSTMFLSTNTSVKVFSDPSESLALTMTYSYTGAIFFARLDYIELEYERSLSLSEGELHFYDTYLSTSIVAIDGASDETLVWDITDLSNPVNVPFTLQGGKACFKPEVGYHEYVAFDPSKIKRKTSSNPLRVANQNLHGMDVPDMVIITPKEYMSASERIARLHRDEGLTVAIVTPEEVYNEFSAGNPDVGAFRRMLKMWYDRDDSSSPRLRYCLIMSRPTYDNKLATQTVSKSGYPRIPIWQSEDKYGDNTSFSTDSYIGMLEDVDANNFIIGSARINVAVGRIPAKSVAEADAMAAKLEKYVNSPEYGSWRNNVMLIADDQDSGEHLKQSENVYNYMHTTDMGPYFSYERLYLDSYPLAYGGTGATYPAAKERMMQKIDEGVMFINYIGHASPREWTHEHLLTWTDITSFRNPRLPFIYAATCEFARWDSDSESGGENMVMNPAGGAISMITPSRTVYINQNGTLSNEMGKIVFNRGSDGKSPRFGDIFLQTLNAIKTTNENKLRYCFVGDPALKMPGGDYVVDIEKINGIGISADNMPELPARSRISVEGVINGVDGNVQTDFNGMLEISLFDAETVIETNGNGDDGVVSTYNDRKTRLSVASARVENGRWKVEMVIPAEISGNYSPALFTCYAYSSETGKEANGSTEYLYVHGYDSSGNDDTEGPEIRSLYMNSPSFVDGGVVNRSPVMFAKLSDKSGINLSDAGIGHKLTVYVDDTVYDDVSLYFSNDAEDITSGTIAYPFSDLQPGEHTLRLIAWDNLNNSSEAELKFTVAAAADPVIYDLSTDVNPASTSVVITVSTDRPMTSMDCVIEVFDLWGRRVWTSADAASTDINSRISATWNLTDKSGNRVPRGIYIYRASLTSPEGTHTTRSEKLAVTAP